MESREGADFPRQRLDAEKTGAVALREIPSRRHQDGFVDATGMDARLAGMAAGKRRAHGLPP